MRQRKKILVVAHDAGGANILAALINKYKDKFLWETAVFGPAKEIFRQQHLPAQIHGIKIKSADFILTGTSWGSNNENKYLKKAKELKILTASFLDHWGNYKARFSSGKNWQQYLPDYLLVGDPWAFKVALNEGIPEEKLFEVENPYFEKIIQQKLKNHLVQRKLFTVLFMSEPIYEARAVTHSIKSEPITPEYQALGNLIDCVKELKGKVNLRIRLHPADKRNKYSALLNRKTYDHSKIRLSFSPRKKDIVSDCADADIILGITSTGLVVAYMLGKKVISYLPKGVTTNNLPFKAIKKIRNKQNLQRELTSVNQMTIISTSYPPPQFTFLDFMAKIFSTKIHAH